MVETTSASVPNSATKEASSKRQDLISAPVLKTKPGVETLRRLLAEFLSQSAPSAKRRSLTSILLLCIAAFVALALGVFVLLVPLTYAVGGFLLHSDRGWTMYQPGKGGVRYVALSAAGWTLYGVTILLSLLNALTHNVILTTATFAVGLSCYGMVCASLLVFQDSSGSSLISTRVKAPTDAELRRFSVDDGLDEESERSALIHTGSGPTDIWWLFIGMQTILCFITAWIGICTDFYIHQDSVKAAGSLLVIMCVAGATSITHAIGGHWKHVRLGYNACQPGKGGFTFVLLQAIGWTLFSLGELSGLFALALELGGASETAWLSKDALASLELLVDGFLLNSYAGILGLVGQIVVAFSLFHYEARSMINIEEQKMLGKSNRDLPRVKKQVMRLLRATHFFGLNILFAYGSTLEKSRTPKISGPDDYLLGEAKMQKMLAEKTKVTGQQYLIIGCGFVGRHLVERLLERGETKIRIFDIVPVNPFPNNPFVEYVRGDVTKYDQVLKACQKVQVIYSTFAIIRFMDRLEWQANLSYTINVGGTENVLRACREANVEICVVTSSSHATTDEHSQPRLGRDESAPYVTRETAHNHYGWTKALADQMCLASAANDCKADGTRLRVAIVRPCSGVFGGDDRVTMEKALDYSVFPGIGAKMTMDWVYCENVVLGHLLLEAAMQRKVPGVDGEAFNISNNEAVQNQDFWFSVMKIIPLCHPERVKSEFDYLFIPESTLWVLGYFSEFVTNTFRGRVSLGRDIDSVTPGTVATAMLHYSYKSDKAKRVLGYEPAYTLDQAIQKSLYDYWSSHFPEQQKSKVI